MDLISECMADRSKMKYAGLSLFRWREDPNLDAEAKSAELQNAADRQHGNLIALRVEHNNMAERIKELEADTKHIIRVADYLPIAAERGRVTLKQTDSGDWVVQAGITDDYPEEAVQIASIRRHLTERLNQHRDNLKLWESGFLTPTEPDEGERDAVMRELRAAIAECEMGLSKLGKGEV